LVAIEDQGMVREVLSGKREAYRRLVEKYQGRVAAAIARITGPRPEVEDLVQETFWQAYRSWAVSAAKPAFPPGSCVLP